MSQANPGWRKKVDGGWRLTFLLDSGASKTIIPRNAIPGVTPYRTKETGRDFRVANGDTVPNEGEVNLKGRSTNSNKMSVRAQVADITRPLAASAEMADADNIVVTHKRGGMIKKVSENDLYRVIEFLDSLEGGKVPVERRGNTYVVEMDITNENENLGVWQKPSGKKVIKRKKESDKMELDQVGVGEVPEKWKAFWEEDLYRELPDLVDGPF